MSNISDSPEQPLSHRFCPEGMDVEDWQASLRRQVANEHPFDVLHADSNRIWGDYVVQSGNNRYRVAFRGVRSERNFCSCLDFRTNGLGTCKHIESVVRFLKEGVPGYPWSDTPYLPDYSSLFICYGRKRTIKISIGSRRQEEYLDWKQKYFDEDNNLRIEYYSAIDRVYQEGVGIHSSFRCYEDVFDMAQEVSKALEWTETIRQYSVEDIFSHTPFASAISQEGLHAIAPLLQMGYGLLLFPSVPALYPIALSLIFTSQRFSASRTLIVASSLQSAEAWTKSIEHYLPEGYEMEIITESDLLTHSVPSGAAPQIKNNYGTVFVENGSVIKEWNHPLSLFLKKCKIDHLYIHVNSLSRFTPVQLSSIIQHISPYLLGPLHLFIHHYQMLFPLGNEKEKWPEELKCYIHTVPQNAVTEWAGLELKNTRSRVETWLELFYDIVRDERERESLIKLLHSHLQDKNV